MIQAPEAHMIGQPIPPAEMSSEALSARGVDSMYAMDQDIVQLQEGISLEFHSVWRQAFQFYTTGAWSRAAESLNRCLDLRDDDGPSYAMLRFINSLDLQPPEDWQGWRVLE